MAPRYSYPVVAAFDVEPAVCFASSRRLLGANRYCDTTAALLTTGGPRATDGAAFVRWCKTADRTRLELGWREGAPIVRPFRNGADLVLPCPMDRCYTACEIAEYAWEAATLVPDAAAVPARGGVVLLHPFPNEDEALAHFRRMDAYEADPHLESLRARALTHGMPCVIDDDEVSIGAGAFSRTYALSALPAVDVVPWDSLAAIPTALVTGSNGKTTTTRLIAAMLATQYGLEHVALSSTDGVKVGHAYLNAGDYSGPTGARLALRDARVKAAVLETARGGILRRGLAVAKADVAVVTNVSADHFGEYGVETLDDIADAKLAVARVLGRTGTIIINADDTTLAPRLAQQVCKVACFALDDDQPLLSVARAKGHATCAVRAAHLILFHDGERHDLGRVAELPLAMGGAATYNIANMAAAALAALALDIPVDDIAAVLARFGRSNEDNPGRLERWQINGATVLMDYAHNPEGLSRLLDVATALRKPGGSLRLLLGQAGNRTDADIAELARVAAKARPIEIVLKELPGYARTRTAAEVPKLLRAALLAANLHDTTLHDIADEHQAAMALVANARAGDVIVLPVHQRSAKDAVRRALYRLTG